SIMNEDLDQQDGNKLYINLGGGVFEETALDAGVDDGGWGWGVSMGDLDHDGDVDIVETNGWSAGTWTDEQSYLFLNDGDGTRFTQSAAEVGIDNSGMGRGTILFDHDNDGDLDIAFISSDIKFELYRNDASASNTNHWVQIRLDTSSSVSIAPDGVGAHVVITAGGVTQHRWMQANSGYLSQGPIVIHAGLGDATAIDRVEIYWSNGSVRVIEDLAIDTLHVLTPCDGDMNSDRRVTMEDFDLFLKAFMAGDRSTDLDANARHNLQDIFAFIYSFNRGCPEDR
ncbi:MAG: CRTAC1 family protein, partial [Phycisphaerales bacterium]|nr:CRTAC1 family protein [Phycisphaerales bacterium]